MKLSDEKLEEWQDIVRIKLETLQDGGPDCKYVGMFHRPIISCLEKGEFSDAERVCMSELENHKNDSLLWTLYAISIWHCGDAAEVLKALQTSHDLSSNLCITWNCMGSVSALLGHDFQMFFAYEASLLIHEAQVFPRKLLFTAYKDKGMWEKAIEMARGIVSLEPEEQGGWGNLESGLSSLRDRPKAVQIAREMTKEFPEQYLAWWTLGMIHLHNENWESTEHAARKAIQLHREDPDVFYLLGISYLKREMMSAAIKNLRKVVKMRPSDAGSWHNLAVALTMDGREQDADDAFNQMETLDPILYQQVVSLMTHKIETGAGPDLLRRQSRN